MDARMDAVAARLVVIGHSHTENVTAAAASAGVALDVLNFWHLPEPFETEGDKLRLKPALRARLLAPVFSLIGGAVHQDVGLVVHPRPFDFIWPGNPDLPVTEGAEIIPFDAVQAAMLDRTQHFRDIMSAVRAATDGPVFQMESPPTYENEELPHDDAGFFHFFGKDAAFSPAWLRYKLWRVHSAIIAAHCDAEGITFIPHPPESVTPAGFLREAFHGTPAHANQAYGALVLAQMQRAAAGVRIERQAAEPPAVAIAPPPVADNRPVEGWVDSWDGGVVRGWAWRPDDADAKVIVELVADGVVIGEGIAAARRPDLAHHGKGDGTCGFAVSPAAPLTADAPVTLEVRARGGAALPNGTLAVGMADLAAWAGAGADMDVWPPLPWRLAPGLTGYIEQFGPDRIGGWAQHTDNPSPPVDLQIWEGTSLAGTATANIWRKDLEEGRQGDGRWAVSAPMPAGLQDGRLHTLALCLPGGTPALDHSVIVRFPRVAEGAALPDFVPPDSQEDPPARRLRPLRHDAPPDVMFSIIVNFYNMRREAGRTLTSLTRAYQRGVGALRYEVLCIDNFSDPPLDRAWIESFGPEFRLVKPSRRLGSPCAAINEAAAQAHGRYVAIMIDGAHVLTPGALREVWDTVTEAPEAVVGLRPWFVGGDQRWLATVGYTRAQEDMLFDKIAWPADGYKLFHVGSPYWESPRPWFDAMIESNCLFVPKHLYRQIGGMDEAFSEAGAGYANLDLFRRAAEASSEPVVALIGEATFHQFHDGTTTNVTLEMKEQRVRAYESRYVEIKGQPYPVTNAVDIRLRGQLRTLQAVSAWQRPSSPARIGATERIRPGSIAQQFDETAQEYLQSVYVENRLHERTTWLGAPLHMAPSDAMAIQEILFRTRPGRIVAVNAAPGVILLLTSLLDMLDLPAARIVVAGGTPVPPSHRVRPIAGEAASPATLAAVEAALDTEEHVLVLFAPAPGELLPFDALRAYAALVTARSYLIFLGTALGQPWLGYSKHFYMTAIRRLLDMEPFAIDHSANPHLVSTSPLGYLQRIEPPPHLAVADNEPAVAGES